MAAAKAVRLRNEETGVVVQTTEANVERLIHGWVPAEDEKKAPAKRSSSSN